MQPNMTNNQRQPENIIESIHKKTNTPKPKKPKLSNHHTQSTMLHLQSEPHKNPSDRYPISQESEANKSHQSLLSSKFNIKIMQFYAIFTNFCKLVVDRQFYLLYKVIIFNH